MEPYRYEHITPPKSVDWRTKGIVGPIKDQHVNGSACGCCWTFATTGVAECIIAMATGKVIGLSEQQLIDCDRAGERAAWHFHACQPSFSVQIPAQETACQPHLLGLPTILHIEYLQADWLLWHTLRISQSTCSRLMQRQDEKA